MEGNWQNIHVIIMYELSGYIRIILSVYMHNEYQVKLSVATYKMKIKSAT